MAGKIKILYIEDNDQNFYLVHFILSAQGFEVIRGRDGAEGIELATATNPSLILLDIQLPIMDGYSIARELRKQPSSVDVPIIALTSYAMAGDREKAMAAGCTGYIEKPIDPKTFTAQVAQYLPHSDGG